MSEMHDFSFFLIFFIWTVLGAEWEYGGGIGTTIKLYVSSFTLLNQFGSVLSVKNTKLGFWKPLHISEQNCSDI